MSFRKISPKEIDGNFISMLDDRWMLVTAGSPEGFNTMTASWGGFGQLWYKPVAFVFIRPQRHTFSFAENGDRMTLSFFDDSYRNVLTFCGRKSGREVDKVAETGITPHTTDNGCVGFEEASLIVECRKMYADSLHPECFIDKQAAAKSYPDGEASYHKMYVCEITGVWIKE